MSQTALVRFGLVPEVARFALPFRAARGDEVVIQTHRGRELGVVLDLLGEPEPRGRNRLLEAEPFPEPSTAWSLDFPSRNEAEAATEPDAPPSRSTNIASQATSAHATEAVDEAAEAEVDHDSEPFVTLRPATPGDRARAHRLRDAAQSQYLDWVDRVLRWGLDMELIDLEWTLDEKRLILYVLSGRDAAATKVSLFAAAEGLPNVLVQPVDANGPVPMPPEGGGGGCGSCGCSH